MKKFFVLFMFFVPAMLFAAIGDNGISVAPDGTELKWEEGQWDFFIMHKSLIEEVTGEVSAQTTNNPQADTCIDPNTGSTYTLTSKHIPDDADIDKAFLIWLSAQDPENLEGNTDNSVTLTFTNAADPSITLTKEVTASKQGNLTATQQGNFEYEALNVPGDSNTGPTGFYTYRVEVSDFMKEIIAKGAAKGMNSGTALYGDYNVKGMDCSNHATYLKLSNLVGGWALPVIYKSSHVFAKKIYFYHGLESYRFESNTITVSGFELPDEAYIKLGLVVFEGDPGLASKTGTSIVGTADPEAIAISAQQDPDNFNLLSNKCNPPKDKDSTGLAFEYTEVFNSISSIYGWKDKEETCIGNPDDPLDPENPIEYAIDADTFLINTKNPPYDAQFKKGDTEFNIKIGANQDAVYTNFLIISVDTYRPEYDPDNPDDPDAADSSDSDTTDTVSDTDSDTADTSDSDSADSDSDHETSDTTDTTDTADTDYNDDYDDYDEYGSDIGPGEYTGPCLPDNTCYEDLVCENYTCVYKKSSSGGCSLSAVD
ncbi:hypothetical protein J5681_03920 [bacterium]|nr:hypothetical protein [bacterium]